MRNIYKSIVTMMFVMILQQNTYAQATRTWVSGVGDDANPCSRTAPCKTFAGAISKTAAGGEISVLDPAGFGAVTITKSITINGEGTLAGILSAGTTGIIVNSATAEVRLIKISIHGAGTGLHGIRVLAAKSVLVEDCTITAVTQNGISTEFTNDGVLTVNKTSISNCTLNGINVAPTATGSAKIVVNNCTIVSTGTAVNVAPAAAKIGQISIANSLISFNTTAINSSTATSTVRLSNTSILDNTTGVAAGLGSVVSFGNNKIAGNTNNGPITALSEQ
jgi:Right handed beta helix region